MSDQQYIELMSCLGFGFGSLFWLFLGYLVWGRK